jgi:dipeptidyl aminopeptidase/acylaminoacyl peptidase
LRPPLLDEAEHWIASRPHDAPEPTKSTQIFIAESRRAATQRRQVVTAALAVGLVVALGLAGLAYWQRQIAVEERGAAVEQRNKMLVSQSLFLASIAQQRLAEADRSTAVLLAIEALPDAESANPRPYVPQAELALGRAWPEPVSFRAHVILAFGLAFSADGRRFVTASFDKTARLWNADSGQPIGEPLKGHTSALLHAEFSPDGRRIVTASLDGTARLWEADTGQPIRGPIEGHGLVYAAAFSPDGRRIITAGSDGTAQLWDADTGQSIGEPLKGHDDGILSVAFNHDGRRIVTASMDKTARLWDALTGRPILEPLKGHEAEVNSAVFSPDGQRILTASQDKTARLWDADTGKQVGDFINAQATRAAFSPDGKRIATFGGDNSVRLWDVITRQLVLELKAETGIASAAFSPDGKRLVTGAHRGELWIWRLFVTTQELTEQAKLAATKCLTLEQRKEFFLPLEPPLWCVEMAKQPYETQVWKDWLKFVRSNLNPPLPTAPEWLEWVASRRTR